MAETAFSKSEFGQLMDHFSNMVNVEIIKLIEIETSLREENCIMLEKLNKAQEVAKQAIVSNFNFLYLQL